MPLPFPPLAQGGMVAHKQTILMGKTGELRSGHSAKSTGSRWVKRGIQTARF